MYEVVICTVNTGRVQHVRFDTWEAARQHADEVTEVKGRKVRVWLERINPPAPQLVVTRSGRSFAA